MLMLEMKNFFALSIRISLEYHGCHLNGRSYSMARSISLTDPHGILPPLITPSLIVPTEFGIIPHITPDIAPNVPVYYSAGDFLDNQLQKTCTAPAALGMDSHWIFMGPGSDFFNFEEGPIPGKIKIHLRNGSIKQVSIEDYKKIVQQVQPNGFISLYSPVLPTLSGRQKKLRTAAATELHFTEPSSIQFTYYLSNATEKCGLFMQTSTIDSAFETTAKAMIPNRSSSLPRLIMFDGHPQDVKKAIALGFDLLVATMPIYYAKRGQAMTFNFEDDTTDEISIDLLSMEFEHDHKPLVEGCDCPCCAHHKRSYLHHLLNVHEMIAETLLVQHNIRHYQRYIEYLKAHLIQ